MKRIDFSEAGKVIVKPQRIAIAISECDNKYNMITLEWFMRTSIDPPMFAISIGHTRFSHECLQKNRHFNLFFPSDEQKDIVKMAGTLSGRDIDKFAESGVKWFHGRYRKLPIINDAKAVFECEITSQINSGDHTIFIGKVKYSWLPIHHGFHR